MKTLVIISGLFISLIVNAGNMPIPFKTDSYNKLLMDNGDAFLMVMWSLDCPPCIKELKLLGMLYKNNPDFNLVLVSTDSPSRNVEINDLLKESGLANSNSWVFSDESSQKLRYSIDPRWYGELPRSYFHNKGGEYRRSVSGLLETVEILTWLKASLDT